MAPPKKSEGRMMTEDELHRSHFFVPENIRWNATCQGRTSPRGAARHDEHRFDSLPART
jgi:hypothetical protein